MENNLPIDLDAIVSLAKDAGEAIMTIYATDFSVQEKSDESPLTEADMASHKTIVAGLEQLTPDIPVLSEESAEIPFDTRKQWGRYWLIDPLDGTKEFVKRNGEFTVNIALIDQGKPVMGVVYVPVTKVSYYTIVSQGAWKTEANGDAVKLQVRPKAGEPVQVAGSRSHAGDSLKQYLENLGKHNIVSMGSSLKLCLVAEGIADIYPRLGPTSEWDTAAAQAVVEGAGGQVTDTQMQPLRYNTKESLLNPYFFVFGDKETDWSQFLED